MNLQSNLSYFAERKYPHLSRICLISPALLPELFTQSAFPPHLHLISHFVVVFRSLSRCFSTPPTHSVIYLVSSSRSCSPDVPSCSSVPCIALIQNKTSSIPLSHIQGPQSLLQCYSTFFLKLYQSTVLE